MGAKWANSAPRPPPASKTGVILRDQLTLAALGAEDAKFALFRTFCRISQNVEEFWVFFAFDAQSRQRELVTGNTAGIESPSWFVLLLNGISQNM